MMKIAIIGMGRMGITHYSIINSHPDIEITSLADPSTMINSLMKKYISGLRLYKDYNELIDKEELDAVLVCTPPNLHHPIIKKAAEKSIHVFVEKPFTTKLTEATELSQLYQKKGLVNQVGYVNRFNDIFKSLKAMLDDSLIGEVIRFKSEMFSNTITKPDKGAGWRAAHVSGGGVVFEMASHAIDLVNYLVGKPDKVVGSSLNKIYSQNVEDAVSSTFLYKGGASGTIYINWSDDSYRKPTNKMEIFGTKGKVQADQHGLKIFLKEVNKDKKLRKGWNTLYITDLFEQVPFYVRGNEFTRQLYHFVECIQDRNINNICTFEDGAKTIAVIDSIFSDFKQNGEF
jgi:scyllo-inositol 2-dehydrogenase (NADP+)